MRRPPSVLGAFQLSNGPAKHAGCRLPGQLSTGHRGLMISQTTEYALRAVVYLADQDGARTTAMIAQATHVPAGYLSKVMQALSRAELVQSQRGLRGGFSLRRRPESLTALEVINAIDPIQRFHTCPVNLHGEALCPLHRRLDEAGRLVEETFGDTTIADMIRDTGGSKPLCQRPTEDAGSSGDAAARSLSSRPTTDPDQHSTLAT
ncbi:RrF2 family transcriptional regulator [Crateriforma spongiae]|uniref:RrF2 family transcriptional regulator n=1 Tax=Crateriforma spongiae TaxID=2724528 RepID=UPI001F170C1C|nr:Rrf2 family transcriptional regulator [Crateriforma spongiae]